MSTFLLRTSSAHDLAIHDGYLRLLARGNFMACAECSGQMAPAPGEAVTLLVSPDGENATPDTFSGTVRRSKVDTGKDLVTVAFVGGAGKLLADLGPADHVGGATDVPAGVVAARIASAAGELLAPGVEVALDAYHLPRWHRAGGMTAVAALDLFVAELADVTRLEIGWRMLPDGTIWIGVEKWAAGSSAATYTDQDADDGLLVYRPNGAKLLPGTTIAGEKAVEVLYALSSPRCEVRHAVTGDPPHQVDRTLYEAVYEAEVVKQRDDGTVDLACDDARIGDVLAVPFRVGIPGCLVTLPARSGATPGARVRLAWASSSPRQPFAFGPDQDPTAAQALALVGDATATGLLEGLANLSTGIVTFTLHKGLSVQVGTAIQLNGNITGPGAKYVKGVSGP